MKRKWSAVWGTGVLITGLAVAGLGFAKPDHDEIRTGTILTKTYTEADFPALAKIPFDQAVQNALTSVQGQLLKTELEDEDGFLVYGVEVVTADKSIVEVTVDAGSGEVLSMNEDNKDDYDSDQDREK